LSLIDFSDDIGHKLRVQGTAFKVLETHKLAYILAVKHVMAGLTLTKTELAKCSL
jgi:hypothetical protein